MSLPAGRYKIFLQRAGSLLLFAAIAFSAWRADYDHIRSRFHGLYEADALSTEDATSTAASARYALDHPEEWLKGAFATKLQNALQLSFNYLEGDSGSFTDAKENYTDAGWDDFTKLQRNAGLVRLNTPRVTQHFAFLKGPAHFQQFSNGAPVADPAAYRVVFEGVGTTADAKVTYLCNAELLRDAGPAAKPKTVRINQLRCEVAGLPKK